MSPSPPNPENNDGVRPKFDTRQYQEHILRRIQENRDRNILVELDCGLGKRVLTYKLITETFPKTRFVITVNSSSSLQETAQYLEEEYGGVEGLGVLSPRVHGLRRIQMLNESRVVLCTARVLANILKKGELTSEHFECLLINEVDTILRRVGQNQVLIQPWSFLLDFFKDRWLIGLSGTLRDDHVVFDNAQIHIRDELQTLAAFLKDVEIISMNELAGTDLNDFIKPTVLDVAPVQNTVIRATAMVLDNLIQSTREEIYQLLREESKEPGIAIPQTTRLLHLMLHELPIPDDLAEKYSGLLMIRKYLYGMSATSFRRYLHHPILTPQIDTKRMMQDWPKITPKVQEVVNLTRTANKTVILSSYLHVVSEIDKLLAQQGVETFQLTGHVKDKQAVLGAFKQARPPAAVILSPVGERDLDLPDADLLIICDTVNTTKTIYQKMKRSRGGRVVFLVYSDTSEVPKLRRLFDNIMQRYPWSTKLGNTAILYD
ncbi:MAG: DEAD/DEAH box helicase family protein [Candidatus Hermodarchaeota archaeon]|nr:DEAD/DEAH box helicase family protein [Candidatus Hermodarchaeota archaeon]